jgi:hypothetical protein
MNRDCGKGKLIPIRYSLVYCIGKTDDETNKELVDPFSKEYEEILATLPPFSNIRMYAWDKQGYANCIRSTYVDNKNIVTESTNRLAELKEQP